MEITLGPTRVILWPDRAVFLPDTKTLVVADLHLGKSAAFRTKGLAVPEGDTEADLARLSRLIHDTRAKALIIAGDLIHSNAGLKEGALDQFDRWLAHHPIEVTLTLGNHDQRGKRFLQSIYNDRILIEPKIVLAELEITHDPADLTEGHYGIAGHLHPGVKIKENSRRSIRASGFYLRDLHHLVVPAFSLFTGCQIISPTTNDRFFVEFKDKIAEIPRQLLAGSTVRRPL